MLLKLTEYHTKEFVPNYNFFFLSDLQERGLFWTWLNSININSTKFKNLCTQKNANMCVLSYTFYLNVNITYLS